MNAFDQLANRLQAFNVNRTIESILSQDKYKKLVPDLVKERLIKEGTYADGSNISTYSAPSGEPYSFVTKTLKAEKGQETGHVTLKDSGKFHQSFSIAPEQSQFSIDYNESKEDGEISDNVPFLENIITLSENELSVLRRAFLPDFIIELKRSLSA